jgi:arylsulfatase A-like enzyme
MKNSLNFLLSAAIILALGGCNNDTQPQQKPNIVFIMIDDLGWTDTGYMGSSYYETPNIDLLAQEGMIFTNAYSNAANCAPTRASLLSGQYSPRHGVFTVARPDRGEAEDRRLIPTENSRKISLDKITIAEALQSAGYTSASIGKWNVGNSPEEQGFDVGLDRGDFGYGWEHFNEDGEYLADKLTDVAVDFITEHQDTSFFLYLNHHAVHTPIEAKQELIAKYQKKEAEGCHSNPEYAAMVESVDQSVGKINRTLEDLGISENTILIFYSDNGGHGTYTCQRPLRGGKGMYYEGGIRVPMFAYWPGQIDAGSTTEEPVISTDFYPTFLDIAGTNSPDDYQLDGKSLLPLFEGNPSDDQDALYWHFPAYLESYEGLQSDSRDTVFRTRPVSVIREGDWKLLMFHEEWVLDGGRENLDSNNAVELYNLKNDLSESNNLATSEPEKRDELLNQLIDWQQAISAPVPNQPNDAYIQS